MYPGTVYRARRGLCWLLLGIVGCNRSTNEPPAPASAPRSVSAAPSATFEPRPGEACGALGCRRFGSAAEALSALLARKPEIVAFGEAHALRGKDHGVSTATELFERQLLPVLAKAGASELVLELLKPSSGCKKAVEKTREHQQVVTQEQAPKNQNRFVALGHAARKLKIVPHLLTPECERYEKLAAAGPDAIVRSLELISSQTQRQLLALWNKHKKAERRLILAYGGAMHNDVLSPEPAGASIEASRAAFSFGAELKQQTGSRYLAIDLIVPEFIADTPVWRTLPWFEHFNREQRRSDVTLFQLSNESFVIIFPHAALPPQQPTPQPK